MNITGDSKYKFLFTIMIKSIRSGGIFYWKEKPCNLSRRSKAFCLEFWHFRRYFQIHTHHQKRWSKRFEGLEFDRCLRFPITRTSNFTFQKRNLDVGWKYRSRIQWYLFLRRSFRNHNRATAHLVSALL